MASLRTWLAALAALLPAAVVAADLPAGAIARIGDYRFYHGPGFQCAVLSPDGRRAASAAGPLPFTHHVTDRDREEYGRTLILWDTATGDRLREMKVGEGPVRHLAFSPDGRVLAAVCSQGVTLFDPETGRLIRRFGDDFDDRARFTPDGKELLGGGFLKHTVSAWDVASGKRVRNWKSPAGPNEWVKDLEAVRHSEPSPDGRLIAWLLYNAPDYRRLPRGAHPSFPFTFPAHALVVTDAASGRPLYRREFGETALLAFTFSPDGRRFLTGGDKLQVWDATTGRELAALDCPGVFRAAVTQDGRRAVVAAYNARVRVWDLETGKPGPGLNAGLAGGSEPILEASPSISADGATVLLATDTTLRLFDLVTGQEPPGPAHRTPIVPRFTADGRMLFTTCDEFRCAWDATGATPVLTDREPRRPWERVLRRPYWAFATQSADGRLIFDYSDRESLRLRETATGRTLHALGDSGGVNYGLFSPDASRVLVCHWEPPVMRLYDTRTGQAVGEFPAPHAVRRAAAFSPDGKVLGWVDEARAVHLHDAATGRLLRTLAPERPVPPGKCTDASLLFSPDGTRVFVATADDGRFEYLDDGPDWAVMPARVLRVADGREVARTALTPVRPGRVSCAAWSPDGTLLALAGEGAGVVRLVDPATGRTRAELSGHRHGVRGLAFSPDGGRLASGGEDNVVFVWRVPGARAPAAPR